MSRRSDQVLLQDMQDACERALSYCANLNFDSFLASTLVQDAVVRNLEILGEACKNISSPLRRSYPDFPWKSIAGMRDKLIHDYFGVNVDIVWDVVTNDLPDVRNLLIRIQDDV